MNPIFEVLFFTSKNKRIKNMEESVWYTKTEMLVAQQLDKVYKRDVKFYQVDNFLKMAKKVDTLAATCKSCYDLKINAEYIAENLSELLKGEIASRIIYEKRLEEIKLHLRKQHYIYPAQYNLYLFSFVGLVFGTVLGYLIMNFVNPGFLKEGLVLGTVIGLISGRIIGKFRDMRLKKENRLL
jgi:F0F1-type ATP synthase assembly protein I